MNYLLNHFKESEVPVEVPAPPVADLPRIKHLPNQPISFYKGKINISKFVLQAQKHLNQENQAQFGTVYSQLLNDFQPAIKWALHCWEYLLSTHGCKFVARNPIEKKWRRGDYRAFIISDYHRFVYHLFKITLIDYIYQTKSLDFPTYLSKHYWENIERAYLNLDMPADPSERKLTPYSYLRCSPYIFMNEYHQQKVSSSLEKLPEKQKQAIELYFLNFLTAEATAERMGIDNMTFFEITGEILRQIRKKEKLVYTLLAQIERY